MSGRAAAARRQTKSRHASRTLDDDDDDDDAYSGSRASSSSSSDEHTTHGMAPQQLSILLLNSKQASGGGGGGGAASSGQRTRNSRSFAGDSPSNSLDDDGDDDDGEGEQEFYDEYQFKIPEHAVDEYRRHKLETAGASDAKMQTYKSIVSRSLRGHRDKQATELVYLGLPMQARREFWKLASGASVRMETHKRYYRHLCSLLKQGLESKDDERQINLDIGRTLGSNQMADSDAYLRRIVRVLRLYTIHRREDGYAQAVNLFAASLVAQGMSDEECFWVLDHITTNLFPLNFDRTCLGMRADLLTIDYYCAKLFPDFKQLLERNSLDFSMLCTTNLIASLMCSKMPYESVYIVWDRMMYFGAWGFFDATFRIIAAIERAVRALPLKNSETLKRCADRVMSSIVDMPKLLATKLQCGQIFEPAALSLRRAKQRQQLLRAAAAAAGGFTRLSPTSSDAVEPDPTLLPASPRGFVDARKTARKPAATKAASSTVAAAAAAAASAAAAAAAAAAENRLRKHRHDGKRSASSSTLSSDSSSASASANADERPESAETMVMKLNLKDIGVEATADLPLTPKMQRGASHRRLSQASSALSVSRQADSSSMTLSDDKE